MSTATASNNSFINVQQADDNAVGRGPHKEKQYTEHQLTIGELSANLATSINVNNVGQSTGLTSSEAERRLAVDGLNQLTPPTPETFGQRLIRTMFHDHFMVMLMGAAVLCMVAYMLKQEDKSHLYLSVAMTIIVVMTTALTMFQESRSSGAMNGFQQMMATECVVLRDGAMQRVHATSLAMGDLVALSTGDKIPADLRLVQVAALKVDNSSLTGENVAVVATVEAASDNVLEARNVVFSGTLVMEGTGIGVVIRVGDHTKVGSIARLVSDTAQEKSTLQMELDRFVKFVTCLALCMALPLFALDLAKNGVGIENITDAVISSFIVIMVSNVPQGLPSAVAGCLTVAAKRLAAHNVFVKRLTSIETLGSVTVIASDKTGTLTQNVMTVTSLWIDKARLPSTSFRHLAGASLPAPLSDAMSSVIVVAGICNMAKRTKSEAGADKARIEGNASDVALYQFVEEFGGTTVGKLRATYRTLYTVPFSSARKWMATVLAPSASDPDRRLILCIKGAPERIQQRCATVLVGGSVATLDGAVLESLTQSNKHFMNQGGRVLGMALSRLDDDLVRRQDGAGGGVVDDELLAQLHEQDLLIGNEMTYIGSIALEDPPKRTVPGAIKRCRRAGIRVVMVTGDHPDTAVAIAKQCNIFTEQRHDEAVIDIGSAGQRQVVVTGAQLASFTDDDWEQVLSTPEIVFARTSPHDKREIVTRMQARHEIVAVTGDGVNDSPALKKADVGVSMGIGGSDVAKDAADIILMDDEFLSLVDGIEQGRIIFDNLIKMVSYTLAHLVPQLASILLGKLLGTPLGLTSLMILAIDLLTEAAPSLSLAYEPREKGVMSRPPRNIQTDRLVSRRLLGYSYLQAGLLNLISSISAWSLVFTMRGISLSSLIYSSSFHGPDSPAYTTSSGTSLLAEEQMQIVAEAQTAYFCTVILGQFYHSWMCKTRTQSVFAHGFFTNTVMNIGAFVPVVIMLSIVYVPFLQTSFEASASHPALLFLPATFTWVAIWAWNEFRKWMIRRDSHSRFTKCFGF